MKIFAAVIAVLVLMLTQAPAYADPDDRQDRCQDKRDCKQEEVRDGVRGNQGERLDGDSGNDDSSDD